jgi:hypothetical protein
MFTTQQLASLRAREWKERQRHTQRERERDRDRDRDRDKERETPVSFSNKILKVTVHQFCLICLARRMSLGSFSQGEGLDQSMNTETAGVVNLFEDYFLSTVVGMFFLFQ